jgi:hypothetical protein
MLHAAGTAAEIAAKPLNAKRRTEVQKVREVKKLYDIE